MIEVLSSVIVIGMVVNMLMMMPKYHTLVLWSKRIKPDWEGKPFNCPYCMGIWCSLFIGLFRLHELTELQMVLVTCASPFASEMFKRLKDALPITI